ncbi:hypothetical protein ABH941_005878 [Streptacidiphilus sp. EB103A]
MATTAEPVTGIGSRAELVARLRPAVLQALDHRVEELLELLPPRPTRSADRLPWLKSLSREQSHRAALVDTLESMCGHLQGRPALGYDSEEPLPAAALEAAEGFVEGSTTRLIIAYRLLRARGRDNTG